VPGTRVGSDEATAEDVVQSTFTNVISKIGSYRGEAALFTWMCTFCRYEIAAVWRRRGQRGSEVELLEDSPRLACRPRDPRRSAGEHHRAL